MLQLFQETKIYLLSFLNTENLGKILFWRKPWLVILHCQHDGCWCPGDARIHGISSHGIDLLHKSHNASVSYPTMHHLVTEMCTYVHISVTKWCIVGYETDAFWDLRDGCTDLAILEYSDFSTRWLNIHMRNCFKDTLYVLVLSYHSGCKKLTQRMVINYFFLFEW